MNNWSCRRRSAAFFLAAAVSLRTLLPAAPLSPGSRTSRRDALKVGSTNALLTAAASLVDPRPSSGAAPAPAPPSLDGYDPATATTAPSAGRSYFPPLTPPIANRATYRYELGRDAWALEQLLAFANVTATIRTVVVKLRPKSGGGNGDGLWVNGPQWPTGEFCKLLDELGTVRHVVLPCNALEHKAPMKAFVRRYSSASVWVTPGQYGPFGSCGLDVRSCQMGYRIDGVLPVGPPSAAAAADVPLPPWSDEFDFRTLYVNLPQNAGPVSEAAFLHRPTRTLVATDAVAFIPDAPPPIFSTYFDRDTVNDVDFWPKSVLQSVFLPLRRGGSDGGSIDDRWPGYGAVRGRLVRAPILRAFADARAPDAVRDWVRSVSSMGEFDRIVTSHFASPIRATPQDFAAAFRYLDGPSSDPPISCGDWTLLDSLNRAIDENELGAPVAFDFKAGCLPP